MAIAAAGTAGGFGIFDLRGDSLRIAHKHAPGSLTSTVLTCASVALTR